MAAIDLHVLGIGLVGPGLASWPQAQAALRGESPYLPAPCALPALLRLPPAERRRAGASVKVAMAAAEEACAEADVDPQKLATIFTASGGDGANCHALCDALGAPASADRLVSPTRFTNSVHNAPAGYWHIAVGSREASTSLCAHDEGFAAGLVAALAQLQGTDAPLLLVASDTPYPQPLQAARPLPDMMGVALLLQRGAQPDRRARATLRLDLLPGAARREETPCRDVGLEALRRSIPCARALPLLEAIARRRAARLVLALQPPLGLQVDVVVPDGGGR
ncbi:MAG TPA: beta-ketoacyl synthase chain length factor [Ramlibacter sp.]|jgi:hypothetical protein|uniref:beta-ketoacyl synthase chain length factor n=1 Tax=Ramlibacter sp. TaxID=1917967 RepID=UPI002D557917|nr:beta-ketoacyl synthase chain length factor [Ramlibacter sp.]HZY19969.1 beta-ketoacyl synthase chain length factor [Ramlibacter sp.]